MANATAKVPQGNVNWGDDKIVRGLAATAQTYYPGAMVGLDSSGNLTKLDDTAALKFDGVISDTVRETVISGEAAGDRDLLVQRPFRLTMLIDSAAAGDEGRPVFALYDNEVRYSGVTYWNFVGWVDQVLSSTQVLIKPAWAGTPASPNAAVMSADGAVVVKEGLVMVTKAGVAAMTIAAPTSGTDDGKRLAFISTTAQAHTLTFATTGFNDLGAAGDVGTFGGAKGDNVTLRAYGGKWWTEYTRNVTFA
jgi:hypothetical protein